jgi:hypothetical protein
MKTVVALAALALLESVFVGCSGKEDGGGDVVWRLDRTATVGAADVETREWAKKQVAGLDVVLHLHGKRFDLGISGAERPEKSGGTYSKGFDKLTLHRTVLNGASVPDGFDPDVEVKYDLKHVYVRVGALNAVLSK